MNNSINDLVTDSAKTNFAIVKFKPCAAKAGTEIAKGLRDILIDAIGEAVRKSIWSSLLQLVHNASLELKSISFNSIFISSDHG